MILVGCDLHTRKQQVALLNTDTGELRDQELSHVGDDVERFYAALSPPGTVGIESTGYSLWFHALLQRLGHTLLVGEAAKIRAMVVRKTKTDRRDARHLRHLLKDNRFPVVWIPDPTTRDLRALIKDRLRLVRIRTMVKNGLHAIALHQRLALGPALWSRQGLAQLQALVLLPHTRRRRDDSLELLHWLNCHIDALDLHVATAAAADPDARRLMTHPGVGPLTALATVLVLGPVGRFPGSKHVVSYIGLAPAVNASADKYRLGHISKQGSALLRWVLGQAAPLATRGAMPRSSASTSRSSGGAAGPKRRWRWPGACSSASTLCCVTTSTTTSSAAEVESHVVASSSRTLRCSRGRNGRDRRVGLTAAVPVRAFSG